MTIFDWLFGLCKTSASQVKPVKPIKEDSLESNDFFYEFDRYDEYKRYQYEIQKLKEKIDEKKRKQIMLS